MDGKDAIIDDFNRIANTKPSNWEHNKQYHNFLLKFVPKECEKALDIGCGTGEFTRLLAKKFYIVEGIDLSPEMIRVAEQQSRKYNNIDYQVKDVSEFDLGQEKYDCIVSIATFHHLQFDEMLLKIREALKPNGVFMILDLYKEEKLTDYLISIAAIPINIITMLIKTGKVKKSEEEIKAWNEHAKHDRYMTIRNIEKITREIMPNAKLKRHLFWRYSLVWKK
ncbi:class I SAM-dependent methyltransferase [Clostridium sp. OS1-26]|uniref:class I SAM-dependent methyltransferase n=1 Tax=Clostridium sp. OS1-26 TaxID=3070681 RepID=UPI0027DEFB80|nr:class I SAM-dependent methyltransferase [Clostridium sp. OS1-26]WML34152.1 class I SAM-dependent methyltransferase [Clostridium sp. OS1-26]